MDTRRHDARAGLDSAALTLLRVGTGAVIAAHGWQKVQTFDAWSGTVQSLGLPMPDIAARLAIVGELGGGIALALGLLTPVGALLVLAVMTTAIATVHAGHGLFASDGGWEYPLVLALIAVFFVVHGAGPVSVDALVKRGTRRRALRHPVGAAPSSRIERPA